MSVHTVRVAYLRGVRAPALLWQWLSKNQTRLRGIAWTAQRLATAAGTTGSASSVFVPPLMDHHKIIASAGEQTKCRGLNIDRRSTCKRTAIRGACEHTASTLLSSTFFTPVHRCQSCQNLLHVAARKRDGGVSAYQHAAEESILNSSDRGCHAQSCESGSRRCTRST